MCGYVWCVISFQESILCTHNHCTCMHVLFSIHISTHRNPLRSAQSHNHSILIFFLLIYTVELPGMAGISVQELMLKYWKLMLRQDLLVLNSLQGTVQCSRWLYQLIALLTPYSVLNLCYSTLPNPTLLCYAMLCYALLYSRERVNYRNKYFILVSPQF